MLSFWKNVFSNVCLGFFGADAILANAKVWDLVLWKCPRRSTTLRSHLICFNFFYYHWMANTFKTPEMCLYLDSEVWAGWFTIVFAGSFHYFKPVSFRILVCQNVTGIPWPFDQLPSRTGKVNMFKLLKCVFISTRTFEADVSIIFVGSFPYFTSLTKINS